MPGGQLVCSRCGAAVHAEDEVCAHCRAPLETVIRRRAGRGRRYVYGKRKGGLSPEVIWLLVVVVLGLLIIVVVQLFYFMRSRKLVQHVPSPAVRLTRLDSQGQSPELSDFLRADRAVPQASSRPWPGENRTPAGARPRVRQDRCSGPSPFSSHGRSWRTHAAACTYQC